MHQFSFSHLLFFALLGVVLSGTALGADTLVLERTIDVHIRSLRKKMGKKSLL